MKLTSLYENSRRPRSRDPQRHSRRRLKWHSKEGGKDRERHSGSGNRQYPILPPEKCDSCNGTEEVLPWDNKKFCKNCLSPEKHNDLRKLYRKKLAGNLSPKTNWNCKRCNTQNSAFMMSCEVCDNPK